MSNVWTAKELIKELSKVPEDAKVLLELSDGGTSELFSKDVGQIVPFERDAEGYGSGEMENVVLLTNHVER